MKIINILPRQSGKTTTALKTLINNDDSILIVPTERFRHSIIKSDILYNLTNRRNNLGPSIGVNLRNYDNKIITPISFFNQFRTLTVNKIIIDDYFFIDSAHMKRLVNDLHMINGNGQEIDIIAFGTVDRQYPLDLFNYIREHKVTSNYHNIKLEIGDEYDWLLIDKLYNNFITDIDATIVIGPGKREYDIHSPNYTIEYLNIPFY